MLFLSALITLPETECAFCLRSRLGVEMMVAAPSVSICDGCTELSTAVFAEENEKKGSVDWMKRLARSLPPRCPRAMSSPVFRALASENEQERIELIRKAFAVGNPAAVCELIERVPASERTHADWVNLGVAFEHLGRFDDAIAAVEHLAGVPEQEPWLLNNRGTARLEAHPCDESTLRQLLADNLRARELLWERKPAGFEPPLAAMWSAAAELHRRLGQAEEVRRCVAAAEKLGPASAGLLLTQARLARADGAVEEARTLTTRALEGAHPESRDAEKARVLLGELA